MKKIRCRIFIVLFIFFVLRVPAYLFSQNDYEGKKISEIQFEGLIQTDVLSVKSILETKVRSDFSYKTINEDIKALYNLELFDDIIVDVVEKDEGLSITYIFEELPTIREVIFRGNIRVRKMALRDRVLLKKDSVFREHEVPDELREIIALYEEKGFPNTTATYEIKRATEKDKKTKKRIDVVDVVFHIEESGKVIIRSLNFSGVSTPAEENKLERMIKTRKKGYLFSAGYLKEDQFELDKREILRYYSSKGYIDTEIVKVDRSVTWNERWKREEIDLTIYIEEGLQYMYRGVEISGNIIFTNKELYSLVELKEESVFDKTKWDLSVQNIRSLLADNGYIYYSMDIQEEKDSENLTVSYKIHVLENNKAHIEHIFITGHEKTKKFVIERELAISEGEIFNANKIQISRERLYNLQYFESVNVDVKPGTELGLVDLIFDVEEQRTGLFTFGLSFSTADFRPSVFEEVSARNFLGRGLILHEKVEIGRYVQSAEVGIDEPWLFNTPTSVGMTLAFGRAEISPNTGYTYLLHNPNYNPVLFPEHDDHDGNELPWGVIDEEDPPLSGDWELNYDEAKYMKYINRNFKVAFRLGRRFARYWGINSELAFSVFQNDPGKNNYEPWDDPETDLEDSLIDQYENNWPVLWKNYLSLTGYRDTRDNTIFATKGYFIAQSVTFYGLGGYSEFWKLNSEINVNVKTFWKLILSARLNMGFILPYRSGEDPVIDEIDYLKIDGMNEGRGWQRDSQFGSLYFEKGEAEFNASLEYRFPISERLIWGLAFFDMSGLYGSPADFLENGFKDFYYSTGLGVGFLIPGFPIRLYLTRRFKYDYNDGKVKLAGTMHSQVFLEDWDFIFAVAGFF